MNCTILPNIGENNRNSATLFTAKITSLKKSITKGDKKKRKDVLEQIAELETALNTQQEEELATLKPNKKEVSPTHNTAMLRVNAV